MDILWIYISNEAVLFCFLFYESLDLLNELKDIVMTFMQIYLFWFFLLCIIIHSILYLIINIIDNLLVFFFFVKKTRAYSDSVLCFRCILLFSVQIWYYIQCLSAFLISFILISFKSIRRLTHVLICKVNKPS